MRAMNPLCAQRNDGVKRKTGPFPKGNGPVSVSLAVWRHRQSARRGAAAFSSARSLAAGSLTLARKIIAAMMYGLNDASR